jgi:hypothetical protein
MSIVPTIMPLVQAFAPAFTAPTFANFSFLLLSWIGSSGKRTICGLPIFLYPSFPTILLN